MAVRNLPADSAGPLVRDAMLHGFDTASPSLTVAEARPLLESPRLRLLLVAEGSRFHGAIPRRRLEEEGDETRTLGELAAGHRTTVGPDETLDHARALLERDDSERLPVVGEDGRLVGLVCFNREKGHYCVDA